MENNYKLNSLEAISLILIIMINKLILNIPYFIVNQTKSGSIANIIYIGIIDFILLLFIIKLFKRFDNYDLIDISEFLGGYKLKILISSLTILFLMLVSFVTIVDFSNVLHTIYFSNFDIIFIIFIFVLGTMFANLIGFKSIIRIISFIIPFAIISVLISFMAVWNNYDVHHLSPILGDNLYVTFVKGLSNTFSMYIIVYFYFLKPLLKEQKDFKKISIISYIIALIILVLTVTSMLTLFNSNNASSPINSIFLLVRQIELGNFIQRVDSLFILLWIVSTFAYLSFTIFLINRILKKIFNIFDEKMLSYSTCNILLGVSLIPINIAHLNFIESTIYKFIVLIFMFGIGMFLLILANFKKIKSN